MEFAAGTGAARQPLAPLPTSLPPSRNRRASGGTGWARRATAPRLSLSPSTKRAASAARGHFLPRHLVRSGGGGDGEFRGEDDASDRSFPTRAAPSGDAKDAATAHSLVGGHPGGVRKELVKLALPAIFGQAIDPLAQLLETAYIGRLGPVELASAAVGVSVFNIVSKLFNIPLLSVTTSFVAEDVSRHDSSEGNIYSETGERKRLPSISSALLLAAAIGVIEALALILGSGILLNMMGVSHVHLPVTRKLFR